MRRLRLVEFRCFASLRLGTGREPVVLAGPNGAGKTSVLEAVSLLSPGRGLRGARLSELRRRGAEDGAGWGVAATLDTPEGRVEIGTGLAEKGPGNGEGEGSAEGGPTPERRAVRIDGRPARSQADLARLVSVVWLTPAMDRLFLDGSEGRRRFLDRLAYGFDAAHAVRVAAYERAARARLRLLRAGSADPAWLAALEEALATNGVAVAALRRHVVDRLNRIAGAGVPPFPGARLALEGEVESWLDAMPALAAEERLRSELCANRARDAESGRTEKGTHRSDLAVWHLGTNLPARVCSTGEQKALLVALVLSHTRLLAETRGAAPLLLLDEVAAHLDPELREAAFAEVEGLACQAWLTGTEESVFAGLRGRARFLRLASDGVGEGE